MIFRREKKRGKRERDEGRVQSRNKFYFLDKFEKKII